MTTRRSDEQFTPQWKHVQLGLAAGAAEKHVGSPGSVPNGAAAAITHARDLWKLTYWQPGTDREALARDGLAETLQPDAHAPAGLDYWAILHQVAAMTPGAQHPLTGGRDPRLPLPVPVPPAPTPAPRTAPAAVKAVTALLYIGAVLMFILVLVLIALGGGASYLANLLGIGFLAGRYALIGIGIGVYLLVSAAFSIVLGRCLTRGRRWAQVTTIALSALAVPLSFSLAVPALIFLNVLFAVAHLIPLVLPTSRQFFTDHARARRA